MLITANIPHCTKCMPFFLARSLCFPCMCMHTGRKEISLLTSQMIRNECVCHHVRVASAGTSYCPWDLLFPTQPSTHKSLSLSQFWESSPTMGKWTSSARLAEVPKHFFLKAFEKWYRGYPTQSLTGMFASVEHLFPCIEGLHFIFFFEHLFAFCQ